MTNQTQTARKILLGVTGGIAAYKTAELTRLLTKNGTTVQVVMTKAACEFITPTTLQALSGNPVYTELWESQTGNGMQHIEQVRDCDAVLIAPASADFLAKLATGQADDLLSTLCLARDCPLLAAPAMNKQMWSNPATQRNVKQLQVDGVTMLGPATGEQACGEVGLGRMLEPLELAEAISNFFIPRLFKGKKIMITAGATMEMIDPVRGITNLSSGKMGYALARVAAAMGAEVTLVSGLSQENQPAQVSFLFARNADDMYNTVMANIDEQDIFIGVAAVADYTPAMPSHQKLKKGSATLSIDLNKTKDIIAEVANFEKPPYCVGFAAETENLVEYASQKRVNKKLPMIVANLVNESMGRDDASLTVISDSAVTPLSQADKNTLAEQLLTLIAESAFNS